MEERSYPELVSELEALVDAVASLAKSFETEREALSDFSLLVERFAPILADLRDVDKAKDTVPIRKGIECLGKEFRKAEALLGSDSRTSAKQLEDLVHDLGRSLGLVLFASLDDVSSDTKGKIGALHKELMGASFGASRVTSASISSNLRLGSESETELEEEGDRILVEEERISLDTDDVALKLKYGDDDELRRSLLGLQGLVSGKLVTWEWINDQAVVSILISRLSSCSSCKPDIRLAMIRILRTLASENVESKEKMADSSSLSVLVRSLARDAEERREAVGLLLHLSDHPTVRRQVGRIQGCIVMLVAILNGEDSIASCDAAKMLNALSGNAQNALHMAEAGYFKPLVQYLKEGSDMSKILMATALSRMELTDQSKASLGEDGAIGPLVKMFNAGKLEAKLSALNALQNLSSLTENIQRLVTSGIVAPLLQLLFSVTSVLMTLREPASAILARIAQSETALVNPEVARQMLSLLNFSSPVIQCHLLQALNSISGHPGASRIRRKMKENGAIQLLLPFLTESSTKIRTGALELLYTLSRDSPDELTEEVGESHINTVIQILSSSMSENEKAAAVGLLGNLPISDKKATDMLKRADLLPILISELASVAATLTSSGTTESALAENIAGVLIRFTIPSNKKLQLLAAEHGVVPLLVKLLSCGSTLAKSRAAISLAQLSQNSPSLSKSRKPRWLCVAPSSASFCEVHDGYCFIKKTFCLVKAGSIPPMIQILEGKDIGADEGVLEALMTLMQDEIWESGSNYLAKTSGCIPAIIKVLESGTAKAHERALSILERVFRIDEHKRQFGESAQGVLVDLAQSGDPRLKSTVARLLAQLELLQVQSSYF
ncbi:U-box domain-containing protein 24-like isoform X2 [Punica granatum]|uniref:Uncharacterized protein n=2 Tax=Punica granatum TaxID=22663 RepID=A0A218X0V4_PUNGR|nr:U-box domain-containing protein 24-like isoform X2 [Punica granatum]OWM78438.1 hypothetical protein CDL15_Pgr016162 [Punica granatum]PKI63008.1 hypothetical protein CRG98_016647 [Punica granatum]